MFRRGGEAPVGLILAHEWGHAIQELVGWSKAPSVAVEASADCLAGVWAERAVEDGVLDRHALNGMAAELFKLGDGETYTWLDASHGQPVQRIAAFTDGTRYAAKDCTPDRFAP